MAWRERTYTSAAGSDPAVKAIFSQQEIIQASASKRKAPKAPKSRPFVAVKRKRYSLDQTDDSIVSSTSDIELDYGLQEYECCVSVTYKSTQAENSKYMLFRNEAMAEKSRNSSSLITSLSYENICKDSFSMK